MKIRKRALRGYAESAVREELKLRQENHLLRMQGLKEELMTLQQGNGRLRGELEELERLQPLADSDPNEELFNRMASERLLQMHIEQSGIVWEAMGMLDKLNENHILELEDKQRERSDLLELVERQMKETLGGLAGNEVQYDKASE